ncbi:unnamed protein product [Lactuca saligna]|uniref:Myb/SANT-like domain-containing protein n=1 Tax=Lactuca saligna TaxID=75948 RepID=A0AA36EI09_LACSI|nr:unnamed protein product [Lactuca saligna]
MSKQEATGGMSKKELVKWIEKMDYAYIQVMIKQQEMGNMIHDSFTSQVYAKMVEELNRNHQMSITKIHLKNRYKTLKEYFSSCRHFFTLMSPICHRPLLHLRSSSSPSKLSLATDGITKFDSSCLRLLPH